MCLNKSVIAGLAAVALGTLVFDSRLFGRALPLLLVAACPLSMLVMMRGMKSNAGSATCSEGRLMGGEPGTTAGQPGELVTPSASAQKKAELRELRDQVSLLRDELARRDDTQAPRP